MSSGNTRLRREIYAIVIIKLLIIFGLWWVFIRDARIEVDGQRLAEHLAQPASVAAQRLHSGEPHAK